MESFVTQAEFARMHSVSRKTVTQWKQSGFLKFDDGNKHVDVRASNSSLSNRGLGNFKKQTSSSCGNAVGDENSDDPVEGQSLYAQTQYYKKEKERHLSRLRQVEADLAEGKVVDAEEARALAFNLAKIVQDQLASMPARVSHIVAGELDVDVGLVSSILERLVRDELNSIADDIERSGESQG